MMPETNSQLENSFVSPPPENLPTIHRRKFFPTRLFHNRRILHNKNLSNRFQISKRRISKPHK